jgi:hypothetical protein
MRKYIFTGIYTPYIEQLINLKQKLGYKFTTAQELLLRFDRFTLDREESVPCITRELADAWCERKGFESDKYRQGRISILIQLSSFLNDLGILSYIPVLPKISERICIPYIYSHR